MNKIPNRSISVWHGIALYVGAVVGSGILILPGMTAGIAGANALISWGAMIALSIPLALTFAFLAAEYPSAGGVSTFVEKAFGRYAGAVIGWFYFIASCVGQFIVPLTGGIYISYAFHLPYSVSFIIASVILFAAVIANYYGLNVSQRVQMVIFSLTVAILASTILLSIPSIHLSNMVISLSQDSLQSIGRSAMLIFWSFFGWEAITSLAPEFYNPRRDILRSTWGALIVIGILYFGIAVSVIGTQSYSMGSEAMNQWMNNASLAQVMNTVTGLNGSRISAMVAFIICLGTTNAFVASISRLGYALAYEKAAPAWFDYIHGKYFTPTRCVLFVGIFAFLGLIISFLFNISLDRLVYVPNSLAIATYILGTGAGVKLLRPILGKSLALVSCLLCLIAYPFVGVFIGIPIGIAMACVAYVTWRQKVEGIEV